MYSHFIPNAQIENLERRKDARKNVNSQRLVVADCQTMEGDFRATINNISSGGVFIDTNLRLFVGQEIALKFERTSSTTRMSPLDLACRSITIALLNRR